MSTSAKLSIRAKSSTASTEIIPETDGPARIPTIKYPVRRGSPAEAARLPVTLAIRRMKPRSTATSAPGNAGGVADNAT